MREFVNLFLFMLLFSLYGCSMISPQAPITETKTPASVKLPQPKQDELANQPENISIPPEQVQIYNLFLRSMQYQGLDKPQQNMACKQLQLEHEALAIWQTAWLLIYAVNSDFNCISLERSIELLHVIQDQLETPTQLKWLNNNQLNLFNHLNNMQKENVYLNSQLKKIQIELEIEISKTQALRTIKSDINKQLDDAEIQLQKENSKIEELKAIETDLNKKLDE